MTTPGRPRAGGPGPRPGSGTLGLFGTYLVLLVWAVLWKLEVPWVGGGERVVKLVPFVRTSTTGPSAAYEVVANAALFVPFGVHLALLVPARRWWVATLAAGGTSLALEASQYVLAVGRSDVTDVLVNTGGALVGFGTAVLVRRLLGTRVVVVVTRVCGLATVAALVVGGLVLAVPRPHLHDVGPLPPRSATVVGEPGGSAP